jgi:elongation factor P
MIAAGDLKKGVTLKIDGNLYRVVNTTYHNPGRGAASMTANLLDIRSGNVNKKVWSAEERLENVYVEQEDCEFLYRDGDILHFMNVQTYDQYEAKAALFGDDVYYLKEGLQLQLKFYDNLPIDYELPTTLTYTVAEAEVAVVGNSAGNVTKRVVTESGLSLVVPLFINVGESIKVDTRDGSYVGRG